MSLEISQHVSWRLPRAVSGENFTAAPLQGLQRRRITDFCLYNAPCTYIVDSSFQSAAKEQKRHHPEKTLLQEGFSIACHTGLRYLLF